MYKNQIRRYILKCCSLTTLAIIGFQLIATAQSSRNVQVLSAVVKDKAISNAEIIFQKNGQQSVVGYTDANGRATITAPFNDDASTTMIIKKQGYSTLVAKCACDGMTYAISPVMTNLDGMRIVLSWGSNPDDLDSHLSFGNQHVFFSNKQGTGANLDVDDRDAYGPETITIEERQFGTSYIYRVHDYSNRNDPSTYNLGKSRATVYVYVGESLVKTYYIPSGKLGNLWTVFSINSVGDIQDINEMSATQFSRDQVNDAVVSVADPIQSGVASSVAQSFNTAGEVAYHAKKYQLAVDNYRSAIEKDDHYGQAYSNLGLAYKKMGRNAEAIWANRRAITYAYGNKSNVVRASSYYNIARIYEERGEYRNALNHYKLAKRNNENVVYDNAIARVSAKLK